MSFVFISHSQYDKTIKNWFKKAIDDGGLETILMEFELLRSDNPGPLIRDIINQSCIGLVVLLGKNILRPPGFTSQFTHNWVGFEIGVAACANKPIIVFEEYSTPIEFPVPFLNHFIRFRFNYDHARYIGQIVKDNMPSQKYMAPDVVECPNLRCNAVFNYWSLWYEMHCPVCTVKFGADQNEIKKRGDRYDYMPSNIT
jgi:hypothetical protein